VRNKMPPASVPPSENTCVDSTVYTLYGLEGGLSGRLGCGMWGPVRESYSESTRSLPLWLLVVESYPWAHQRDIWRWQVAATCADPSACRQHSAQTVACLPLGHSLGGQALAYASVEVMNWRSAPRHTPFPFLLNQFARMPIRIGCRTNHLSHLANGHLNRYGLSLDDFGIRKPSLHRGPYSKLTSVTVQPLSMSCDHQHLRPFPARYDSVPVVFDTIVVGGLHVLRFISTDGWSFAYLARIELASPHLGITAHTAHFTALRCRIVCLAGVLMSKAGLISTPGPPPGPVVGKIEFYDMPQHVSSHCLWDQWARVDPEHAAVLHNTLRTVKSCTQKLHAGVKDDWAVQAPSSLDARCRICEMTVHTA
jgi:hypothetical protein